MIDPSFTPRSLRVLVFSLESKTTPSAESSSKINLHIVDDEDMFYSRKEQNFFKERSSEIRIPTIFDWA